MKEVEQALHGRAFELACALTQNDRGFLEKRPHGVDLAFLPLDQDNSFHA